MEDNLRQNPRLRNVHGKTQEWNTYNSDMAALKLSKQELAKKLASRQSHNLALARAELIEKNRQKGSSRPFSPAHSAKLRAASSKSVDEAMGEADAVLARANRIKQDMPERPSRRMFSSVSEMQSANQMREPESNLSDRRLLGHERHDEDEEDDDDETFGREHDRMTVVTKGSPMREHARAEVNPYPLTPQGWSNLSGTIQLVVKTCEALWQQLEEERMRRERLHEQLLDQRRIISTLTDELMQIQGHQVSILQELQAARAADMSALLQRREYMNSTSYNSYRPRSEFGFPRTLTGSDSNLSNLDRPDYLRSYKTGPNFMNVDPQMRRPLRTSRPNTPQNLTYQGKSKSASQIDLHTASRLYDENYGGGGAPLFNSFNSYRMNDR